MRELRMKRLFLFVAVAALLLSQTPVSKGANVLLEHAIEQKLAAMQDAVSAEMANKIAGEIRGLIEKIKEPQIQQNYQNRFEQEFAQVVASLEKLQKAGFEARFIEKLREKGIGEVDVVRLLQDVKITAAQLAVQQASIQQLAQELGQLEASVEDKTKKRQEVLEKINKEITEKDASDDDKVIQALAKILLHLFSLYGEQTKEYLDAQDMVAGFKKYLNHLISSKKVTNAWDILEKVIPKETAVEEWLK